MKRELADTFNREIETYRKALLYYAKLSDWNKFEEKAGKMFDYVESVEYRELERRFFKTFGIILAAVLMAVTAFFTVDFEVHQEWFRWKNAFLFSAISVCTLEIYFFVNYRTYVEARTNSRPKRRNHFIQGIESDFRKYFLSVMSGRI